MADPQEIRLCPIAGLSVELLRMILSALDDVISLQRAALSCPLFFNAFVEAEASITADVLLNQVDSEVLAEAVAADESSLLCPHDPDSQSRQAIEEFIENHLRQRQSVLPDPLSLKASLRIGRLHSVVTPWSDLFIEAALQSQPCKGPKLGTTQQEKFRVQRALYRFEIYCNLFRESIEAPAKPFNAPADPQSLIYDQQKELFFDKFAPWENEQLGCIYDFLVYAVSPAFNDVVEHDVHWGACGVEYGDSIDSPFIQGLLSHGLQRAYELTQAKTYEEREKVLCTGPLPGTVYFFLYEGFQNANEQNIDVWLNDLTPENEDQYIRRPFFDDPDSGPADVWRWAHLDLSWHDWIYEDDREDLRQWGYVMWDRSRLEKMGIFEDAWTIDEEARQVRLEEEDNERQRQRAYLQKSQDRREVVAERGGSGYWSWGDESKVRWEKGKEPERE